MTAPVVDDVLAAAVFRRQAAAAIPGMLRAGAATVVTAIVVTGAAIVVALIALITLIALVTLSALITLVTLVPLAALLGRQVLRRRARVGPEAGLVLRAWIALRVSGAAGAEREANEGRQNFSHVHRLLLFRETANADPGFTPTL